MKKFPLAGAMAILCVAAPCPTLAAPGSGPSSPCESPAWPPSAAAGSPPSVAVGTLAEFPHDWALQPCAGWELQRFSSFAVVVGTFEAAGMDAVLSRIGAISTHKGVRYWSVTDRRLEPLITDAVAVDGLRKGRSDFAPAEMRVGRDLFFTEHDNRSSGPVLYRMRVIERSPDHLVVDIENADKIRRFLLTVFEPGDLRTTLFISRSGVGTWRCYALSGFHPTPLTRLLDSDKSYLNRLIALYGHLTGSDDSALPWAK